jgi:hypothetical protein
MCSNGKTQLKGYFGNLLIVDLKRLIAPIAPNRRGNPARGSCQNGRAGYDNSKNFGRFADHFESEK